MQHRKMPDIKGAFRRERKCIIFRVDTLSCMKVTSFKLEWMLDIRQRMLKCSCTRKREQRRSFLGRPLGTGISGCAKRRQGWRSTLKRGRVTKISSGDIRAIQTQYIAEGCPLLDVIGHPLTSTPDGKFIGRWFPSLRRAVNGCKVGKGCRDVSWY